VCALGAVSLVASAQTIRIANQGDALSLDPHSLNESLQLSVTANVYETLVGRNKDLSLAPLLATSWKQTSPNVWRFELRKGVVFHDGTPFTADDVVFSFARAQGDGSDMRATPTTSRPCARSATSPSRSRPTARSRSCPT
jgi:peptide/nickel transport system substrate-binding protein